MALSESDPGTFWIIVLAICLAGNYLTNYVIMLRGHEGRMPFLILSILWPVALIASLCTPACPERQA